jgi:hypothetical protein
MSKPHRSIRGTLQYTSDKPERKGQERGREHFQITVHGDGRRTLAAKCEIDDPPPVLRDVVYSVDAHWRPVDAFVRLSVGDRFVGSSWFRFGDGFVECEAYTALEGRVSQRVEVPGRLKMFGTHPIQADAWLVQIADLTQGEKVQRFPGMYLCSLDHRGATGPLVMQSPVGLRLAFLGREAVTVKAGTFDALHFLIGDAEEVPASETRNEPGRHPRYELWCTADGDFVTLKAWVSGYMMTAYELVAIERS